MIPKFLTIATARFTNAVKDDEPMSLFCLVANQHDKRNPYTVIVKVENGNATLIKSGEGLVYRVFDDIKQHYRRYGWLIVAPTSYQDDKRDVYDFNNHDSQVRALNYLSEEMDTSFIVETFKEMEMPFSSHVLNQNVYQQFGDWA